MLIDSGSNVSFLRKKEWKRIGKPKLTDVDNSFITLSGRILDVKGMYMANVFFEGQEYQLPVFVANRIRNNIAGHPWLIPEGYTSKYTEGSQVSDRVSYRSIVS